MKKHTLKIAIIKLSAMGDVIHTLPAVSDIKKNHPNIHLTWIIEDNHLKDIPTWHPGVDQIIPIVFRQPVKKFYTLKNIVHLFKIAKQLRQQNFDMIIDCQGLWKTALLSNLGGKKTVGYHQNNIREIGANLLYKKTIRVDPQAHVINRTRQLVAKALSYQYVKDDPNYGIPKQSVKRQHSIFLAHGTTWRTKHWPDDYWCQLAKHIVNAGYHIQLTWGNRREKQRAELIARPYPNKITILERSNLTTLKQHINQASALIGVDTGLLHLAAALNIPTLAIFGPTNPQWVKPLGAIHHTITSQVNCQPCQKKQCPLNAIQPYPECMQLLTPDMLWQYFMKKMAYEKQKSLP